jgi:hypothetical protein
MPAQQIPAQNLTKPHIVEEGEKEHLNRLASHLAQATNSQVKLQDIQPVINQHPLPQFAPPAASAQVLPEQQGSTESGQFGHETLSAAADKDPSDSDFVDFMEGMRGRPRNAPAIDFLKGKLNLLKKKYGDVKLVKK